MTPSTAGGRVRRPIPRLRWWIGGLLFLSTVINYIDRQTLSVLAPYLQRDYHWTNTDFATVLIAFRIAYTVMQGVGGRIMDLLGTIGPLTDSAFGKAVDTLEQMERKGYFAFAKGGIQIADNIVTSFTEDDVKHLGDNVVLILNVVKDMTQPQIMTFVRNTLMVAESEIEKPVDTSLVALIKQMNDPAVRRGLALTMRVLSVVGAQASENGKISRN